MSSLVSNREFRSQIVNGATFTLSPADITGNFVGVVGERIQTKQTVRVGWKAEASSTNTWEIVTDTVPSPNTSVITQSNGNFEDDGFAVGDIIALTFDSGGPQGPFEGEVLNVSGDTMFIEIDDLFTVSDPASTTTKIFGISPLTAANWLFGLNENTDNNQIYVSKLDGEQQKFYASGVGPVTGGTVFEPTRDTTPVTMIPAGSNQSWLVGGATVEFVKNILETINVTDVAVEQEFMVIHEFMILPYYQDGELANLQALNPPALFASGNTLKYILRGEFLRTLSNPNSLHPVEEHTNLGSVGWFNQNINGLVNDYSVKSLTFVDQATASSITSINGAGTTEFTVVVENLTGPFTATTKFIMGVSLLPDPADYQNTVTTYEENFVLDDILQTVGAGAVASSIFANVEGTFDSANQITLTGELTYSIAQQLKLGSDKNYAFWVIVQNDSIGVDINNQDTDRVNLLIDVNNYIFSADVPDLMFVDESEYKIIPHDEIESNVGYTDYKGWIEDGILVIMPFQLNTDLSAQLAQLTMSLIAFNSTTGNSFIIQLYNFNISGSAIVAGVQQIFINTDRGYQLVTGSIFNKVFIENTGPTTNGPHNVEGYDLRVGFKINHEEWLQLLDADPVFIDNTKPFDGLNKLTSNYSNLNGYQIKLALGAKVSDGTSLTDYRFLTPDLDIQFYDKPIGNWSCGIMTLTPARQPMLNTTTGEYQISSDDLTEIEAKFTLTTGTVPDDLWGWIHIDIFDGSVFSFCELSTLEDSKAGNLLIPLPGESFTKITVVGNDVFLNCLIDDTLIDPTQTYCITARLSTKNTGDLLAVDIEEVCIGGDSGQWNITLDLKQGGLPVPDGVPIFFNIIDDDTAMTLGSGSYLTGDTIGVTVPQSSTTFFDDMLPFFANTDIDDGGTLFFSKRLWADAEDFVDRPFKKAAINMRIEVFMQTGLSISNIDQVVLIKKSTDPVLIATVTDSHAQNVNRIFFADRLNNKLRAFDSTDLTSQQVAALTLARAQSLDTVEIIGGQPVLFACSFTNTATFHNLERYVYVAFTDQYTLATSFPMVTPGIQAIAHDPNRSSSGRAGIWLGFQSGTFPGVGSPARFNDRLKQLQWNGVVFVEVDFGPVLAPILGLDAATVFSVWSIVVASNSDVYISVQSASNRSYLIRLRQTGPSYTNPADWTAALMVGDPAGVAGDTDGTGVAAEFFRLNELTIIGYDGVIGPTTGTNPIILATDSDFINGGNEKIVVLDYVSISDEYSRTTKYGAGPGVVDGIGTAALFDVPLSVTMIDANNAVSFEVFNNHAIRRLNLNTDLVTTISGDLLAGNRENVIY